MKKILIYITVVALAGTGCKKGWLDVNTNPNRSTSTNPELVLPAAQVNTAARFGNQFGTFAFLGAWVGYQAASSGYAPINDDLTTYNLTSQYGNGAWTGIYDNLADYSYIEKSAKAEGKGFYEGMAKIMKAYNFAYLVDLFNDIPYTQALQGTDFITPTYDNAQTIYGDLFTQINQGMVLINASADLPKATSDLMFARIGGNIKQNWLKFANTVKLRMLLRMAEMPTPPAYFAAELAKVSADVNGFITIDVTVNPGYTNSTGQLSPFWGANYAVNGTYSNDYWRAHAHAVAFYLTNNDPRVSRVYSAVGATFVGNVIGVQGSASAALWGPGLLKAATQDAVLLSAAESYFLQAEAALRGWIPASAEALYKSGVEASFTYLGVPSPATAAATYYNQAGNVNVQWASNTTLAERLTLIMRQKWIALNGFSPFEPFTDHRRFYNTTYSPKPLADLPLSQSPARSGRHIPFRLLYPISEIRTNNANIPQGIDGQTSKPFWMR